MYRYSMGKCWLKEEDRESLEFLRFGFFPNGSMNAKFSLAVMSMILDKEFDFW